MLQIVLPETEFWDEMNEEFVPVKEQILKFEHSLVSISKWESKWCKPFFSVKKKTVDEMIDYIRCMSVTSVTDDTVFDRLTFNDIQKINDYIEAPMTATTIHDNRPQKISNEILTSEVIYCDMIMLGIPFECQKWHLNRLLTLIRVCDIKGSPSKKMSKKEIMAQNAAINAARRKKIRSRG